MSNASQEPKASWIRFCTLKMTTTRTSVCTYCCDLTLLLAQGRDGLRDVAVTAVFVESH
jgi:hypothetical protein